MDGDEFLRTEFSFKRQGLNTISKDQVMPSERYLFKGMKEGFNANASMKNLI